MLVDLTAQFDTASEQRSHWSKARFEQFCASLSALPDVEFDWDDAAGEGWATFLKNQTIALACAKIPLVFVRSSSLGDLDKACKDYGVVVIEVKDFDEKTFQLASGKISEIFDITGTDIDGDSTMPLSANDVWFHTI